MANVPSMSSGTPSPPPPLPQGRGRNGGTGHEFVGCRQGRLAAAGTPFLPPALEREGAALRMMGAPRLRRDWSHPTRLGPVGRDSLFHREMPEEIDPHPDPLPSETDGRDAIDPGSDQRRSEVEVEANV